MKTGQFFKALFDNKPDDHKIVAFNLPDKKVRYYKEITDSDIDRFSKSTKNEYFGLGTVKKTLAGNKRPGINHIDGIGCFWLDVDIISPFHKSQNAPNSINECVELVDSIYTYKPNIIVDSGHGIHAYWTFNEYYEFEDDNDRQIASEYSKEFQASYRNIAKDKNNWKIDSTHDLSRILRIPGSHNYKDAKNPKLVEIIRLTNKSLSLKDLLDVIELPQIVEINAPESVKYTTIEKVDAGYYINAEMEPPANAFFALCENEKKFKLSWENKRSQRELTDQSPSSYDYSLANYALMANWSTQDVIALLVAHRRTRGHDLKLKRLDSYYLFTIAKVKADIKSDKNDLDEEKLTSDPELGFKYIADKLGINIIEIEKHGTREGAIFYVTVYGFDKIRIGNVDYFASQARFSKKIFEIIGLFPKPQKTSAWHKILHTMAQVMSTIEYDDLQEGSVILVPLAKYLNENSRIDVVGDEVIGIIAMNAPYVDFEKNEICMNLNHFLDYLKNERISLNRAETCSRLKGIGFKERIIRFTLTDNQKKDYNLKGKQLQKRYWTANKDTYDDKTKYL